MAQPLSAHYCYPHSSSASVFTRDCLARPEQAGLMINLRSTAVRSLIGAAWLGASIAIAAPGPGINQATFQPSEVGTEIYNFSNSVVGAQPTMADFQHGYLVINAAHSLDGTQSGRVSWINFSNPRSPSLIT